MQPQNHKYHISVGSNVTQAAEAVRSAIQFLENLLMSAGASDIYSTPPLGNKTTARYTNAVVEGFSELDESELNNLLKEYERSHGRTPEDSARGEIAIDLDIVCVDGRILRTRDYAAPHFRIGFSQLNQTTA